jgi:hypothetical protein
MMKAMQPPPLGHATYFTRSVALLAAGSLLLFASMATASSERVAVVTKGQVTPNRGARGIKLGMTRAQVVARLGQPVYKNANGFMQYGKESAGVLFDVYLDVSEQPARVRLLGIYGAGFCLVAGGPCLKEKGGVGKLRARYDGGLKTVKLEDGEKVVWLKGKYRGCKVFTDFGPAGRPSSARVGMVFIGFQSGSAC